MKLSALNSAVRALEGPPTMSLRLADAAGNEIILEGLAITKQSLLASLKARFGESRATETGLTIVGSRLCHEGVADQAAEAPAPVSENPFGDSVAEEEELEDMFG